MVSQYLKNNFLVEDLEIGKKLEKIYNLETLQAACIFLILALAMIFGHISYSYFTKEELLKKTGIYILLLSIVVIITSYILEIEILYNLLLILLVGIAIISHFFGRYFSKKETEKRQKKK
ncbi:hypothetical protein [Miniphocaeibacter halophilus]|uniref:Uncharacterized protein n=1 Tax=Miniphocaeibacter halophilus TaxID=2931922 RepID=A0AC61MMN1_9FIRM|nr:hypothetical protein [Miniphocaeibacter halophilus]QQK06872.1 hypothetical protein JFY71_05855 [Miniphocaeibacter halophilus]